MAELEPYSWFFGAWSTTLIVQNVSGAPLAGASVKIKDQLGNEVFAGTTDANGRVTAVLNQFKMQGSTKTTYGPYTVTAQQGGVQAQSQVTADRVRTVTLSLAVSPTSAAILDSPTNLSGDAASAGLFFVRGFQTTMRTGFHTERGDYRPPASQTFENDKGELGTEVMNALDAALGEEKQGNDSFGIGCSS